MKNKPEIKEIKKNEETKKSKKILKHFLLIVGSIIAFLLVYVFVMGYFMTGVVPNDTNQVKQGLPQENKTAIEEIVAPLVPIKEHTNFLIVGVDSDGTDGSRTDTIMIGCFNATTKDLDVISIPRDTYIVMPKVRCDIVREQGPFKWAPKDGGMKICEIHHYAGDELGIDFLSRQLEEMLDIDLEYYVKIDYNALHYIINEIGGVEFDVPQRMIYDDPTQDLHIDLHPGLQVLDGNKAEQLLRYRHGNFGSANETKAYPRQDLDRVETQQNFLKAMIGQTLLKENIISNIPALASAFYQYVDTNFLISDVPKYLRYVKDIKQENIHTDTLPGTPKYIKETSYVVVDEQEAKELVETVFMYTELVAKTQDSKNKSIQILNGGHIKGLASQKKNLLEEQGYSVKNIDDYLDEKQLKTRIITKKKNIGSDLIKMFPDSKIEINKDIAGTYDIVIVLGTDEN